MKISGWVFRCGFKYFQKFFCVFKRRFIFSESEWILPQITQINTDFHRWILRWSAKSAGEIYLPPNKRKQKFFANTCGRFNSHKAHEGSQIIFFENLREKLFTTKETKENKSFFANTCGRFNSHKAHEDHK